MHKTVRQPLSLPDSLFMPSIFIRLMPRSQQRLPAISIRLMLRSQQRLPAIFIRLMPRSQQRLSGWLFSAFLSS